MRDKEQAWSGQTFEQAFRDLFPRAVRVAIRILRDHAAAEDVAAEALARAHLRWARLATRTHRDGWVLRTTANLAIDVVRRRVRVLDAAAPPGVEDQVVLRRALVEALRLLPRRQREAVALRYLCGLSEVETAAEMRVAVGTVKSSAHRGIEALRASLGQEVADELTE